MTEKFAVVFKQKTVNPKHIARYFAAFLATLAAIMVYSMSASAQQITDSHGDTYQLVSGHVMKCNAAGCTALTGSSTTASQLVATGNGTSSPALYMLANNGGASFVWHYTGSGTVWTQVTGASTTVTTLVATSNALYILASNNSGQNQVWHYSGSGTNWTAITGLNTTTFSLYTIGNGLFMQASNNGGETITWMYSGSGTDWIPEVNQ